MRAWARVLTAAVVLGGVACLPGCYLLKLGVGQAQLLASRRPMAEVLDLPATTPENRKKLLLIGEAKRYAETVVGLKPSTNYTAFVGLDRDAVSYVVSAAPKDKLEPKTWWFPIIGSVPYKGHFAKVDAEAEQRELDDAGYDTIMRGVPAFSTLGWLSDPVYSPFLKYDEVALVNVIIHELTHVTLYLAGQASFNEGFATFVGNQGAADFFAARDGKGSATHRQAIAAAADNAFFTDFVAEVSTKLEALYASDRSREEKIVAREAIFDWARTRFETAYKPKMGSHQFRHFPGKTFNNAALVSYRTYYKRLDRFERAHQKLGGKLDLTIAYFRDTVAKATAPEAFLDDFVKKP